MLANLTAIHRSLSPSVLAKRRVKTKNQMSIKKNDIPNQHMMLDEIPNFDNSNQNELAGSLTKLQRIAETLGRVKRIR